MESKQRFLIKNNVFFVGMKSSLIVMVLAGDVALFWDAFY